MLSATERARAQRIALRHLRRNPDLSHAVIVRDVARELGMDARNDPRRLRWSARARYHDLVSAVATASAQFFARARPSFGALHELRAMADAVLTTRA